MLLMGSVHFVVPLLIAVDAIGVFRQYEGAVVLGDELKTPYHPLENKNFPVNLWLALQIGLSRYYPLFGVLCAVSYR